MQRQIIVEIEVHAIPADSEAPQREASVEYFWTGDGDLTFGDDNNTYRPLVGGVADFSMQEGRPDRRMSMSLVLADDDLLATWIHDRGPLLVKIEMIQRATPGAAWARSGLKFEGRISRPTIRDRVLTLELETRTGDIDRGEPLSWNHQTQIARFPGDRGLEYMATLSRLGREEDKWPPDP